MEASDLHKILVTLEIMADQVRDIGERVDRLEVKALDFEPTTPRLRSCRRAS